jgi:uncharacterized phage-associated protein
VANVFDVAAYILHRKGMMSAMKLQKLVYYSQAWSLVWDDKPLFREKFRAWPNGPVVYELFKEHQGQFQVSKRSLGVGNLRNLSAVQRETIDKVLEYYGDKSPQWLSDLTHMEDPWRIAREGLSPFTPSNNVITLESMAEYYGRL